MALFLCNHAFYDKRWRKKSCTCKFYMYCLWHSVSILDARTLHHWIVLHTLSVCNALILYCIVHIVKLFSKTCDRASQNQQKVARHDLILHYVLIEEICSFKMMYDLSNKRENVNPPDIFILRKPAMKLKVYSVTRTCTALYGVQKGGLKTPWQPLWRDYRISFNLADVLIGSYL